MKRASEEESQRAHSRQHEMGNAASLFACFGSKTKRRGGGDPERKHRGGGGGGHKPDQRSGTPPKEGAGLAMEPKPQEENGFGINEKATEFISKKRDQLIKDQLREASPPVGNNKDNVG